VFEEQADGVSGLLKGKGDGDNGQQQGIQRAGRWSWM